MAAAGGGSSCDGVEGGTKNAHSPRVLLNRELAKYVMDGVELDVSDFSLPRFWLRKTSSTRAEGTVEVVSAADMPHLALVARLYVGVEATSCQSERNVSALSFLTAHLRSTMSVFKVEQMMFLRLNQGLIPEIKEYKAVKVAREERRKNCMQDVQDVQSSAAGEFVEIEL